MKKIVLIGGHGFLGKNIQNEFENSPKYKILSISRRNGYDLIEKNKIRKFLEYEKPDYVINCAASVGSLDYVSTHPADIISYNIMIGINLWEILKEINYQGVVINPISNCTYPGNANVQKENAWWDGMVHPSIISYGTAKKTIFMINKCYEKQYNIKTINLIMPNSYGEFDYDDENKVHALNGIIIRILKTIKENKNEFTIWGTGNPIREWGYMPDTSKFIKYIIDENITNIPNPINIGQGLGFSINEITEMVINELNVKLKIKHDTNKIDGDPIKILDPSEFKNNFPNFKFTPISEGIKNTLQYYKKRI